MLDEESFILPAKAFDLIKNLPEGEVEVKCDEKYVVTIQMERLRIVTSHFLRKILCIAR